MASRDDHAASRRYLPAVLIVMLMTSVGSSNSMSGSRSSGCSSCSRSSSPGHPLKRAPTSTTPPQAWHRPPCRQARARGTATATATACFFHHHYRWRSTNLSPSSSCSRPDGHPAAPRRWFFGEQRTAPAGAARRRPLGALGTTDDTGGYGSDTVRRRRSKGSSGHAFSAAIAGGREMREAEGAAALAAGAVERRTNGHGSTTASTTPSSSSSSSVERSGCASLTPPEMFREGGDEAGDAARHQSLLSRGMAATERFFANDRMREKARAGGEEIEGLRSKERGFTGEQESKVAAAAAGKLEGEQEARDQEGLRTVPRHVAFVMDGNGRWAASRNLPRGTGHAEGARRAGEAVEACRQLGVEFVTLYAFSTENWRRPDGEVTFLMDLMEKTLAEQRGGLRRNGIRLTAIGELDRLPERLRSLLREIEEDSGSTWSGSGNTPEANGAPAAGATAAMGVSSGPPSAGNSAAPGVKGAAREFPRERGGEEGLGAGGRAAGAAFSLAGGSARSGGGNDGDPGAGLVPPLNTAPAPSPSTTTTTTTAASEVPLPPPPPPPRRVVPMPTTMTLCLAISYGGRSEVAAAAQELAAEAAAGRLDPADIDEAALGRRLSTARLGIPDPDLVVRTSGESRLSNLLVWQSAYSELCVVQKAWPDFRRPDLVETFRDFGRRRRRFGKTPEQIAEAP